jgi:hypothetical protein
VLRPKLMRSLSGSLDPADESATNNVGRNTIFELSLASEWRRAGLDVVIGEPDLRLILGPQEFAVECKRVPSRLWSARSGCSTCVLQCCKSAHAVQVFTYALQTRDKNDATFSYAAGVPIKRYIVRRELLTE